MIYRVVVAQWSLDDAIKETKGGGFRFHEVWVNLEPWIRKLDLEDIRKRAGLK